MKSPKKLTSKLLAFAKQIKANKPAMFMMLAGTVLVVGVIFGALTMNDGSKQDVDKSQPASHHKTAQKTTTDKTANTEQTTTSTSETTPTDAKKSSSATSSTPSKSTSSSAQKSTSSGNTTPTTYPTADPDKIKQYAYTPTYPNDPHITSIETSVINNACGQSSTGFHYDIHFLANAKAGTFAAHWELVSGPIPGMPTVVPSFAWNAGMVEVYDNLPNSFAVGVAPYTVRLHVTSPNDIYSNAITITNC